METTYSEPLQENTGLYKWASLLALITIAYNLIEGVVSVLFGLEDETIALFGFGLDSFIEVISGVGIWHMIRRLRQNGYARDDKFEQQALRITGAAFFMLTCNCGNKPLQGRAADNNLMGDYCGWSLYYDNVGPYTL